MAWREKPLENVGAGATGNAGAPGPEREKVFLNNGLTLSVQSGDITKLVGDVVVVGEDTNFSGRGAVAGALIKAGGAEYERYREFLKGQVQREGFKHLVYRCPAGPCFYFREVFHAMTLVTGHKIPDWVKHLENLFYNVGIEADISSFHNVVTPLLGAGKAKGTVDISLQALVNGLSRFAPQHLKQVIIVEYDQNKAAEIRGKLKQILSQDERRRQGQLQESGRGAGREHPGNLIRPAQGNFASGQTQGRGSGSSEDPMNQGAWGGTGRGNMGQGGRGGGAGQPFPHQRNPTSSAQQQSGNPQNIPTNNMQAALADLSDEFGELAISRHNDNTNQKNIINYSTAQDTHTPSGGTNQFDRQTTSRQGVRGRGLLLVQPNYKEGSPVDRPTGRDPRPEQNPDLLNKDSDSMEKYFGDGTGTQRPNQPNSSMTSGSHFQSGQRDNSAGKGRGRQNENPVDVGRGRQGRGVGNHGSGATPHAARGSDERRPGGENGQNGRPGKGSGGRADSKEYSAPGNSNRRVTEGGQDPTLATSPSPHHGAHGGSGGGNVSHQGIERGGAPPAKSTQGPGKAERIDPKSSAATPGRSCESGAQGGRDFHNRGDNEMKKKGENPPAIESSPTVSLPMSQSRALGQRPRDAGPHTVPGEGKESDEEEEHAGSHKPSMRTGGTNTEEKKDKGQGKTNAGRAGHSGEKKGQQPDMTVQSGSPSPRHAKTAQTAEGSTLTRPATFVPNDHRRGRKDEEAQRDAIALPWKSNEDPPTGSRGGGGYQGTRQEEDEISNEYVQPAKAPQMHGQNLQQDAELKDRDKNEEREDDPNLAGRNKGKGKREKDKREKQMKERKPKSKGASDSKGPKQSSASLGQGAVAQEPDMTGAAFMGSMPDGKMVVTTKPNLHLEGYPDYGTILIEYSFPNGTQGPQHPAPEQPYKGTFRRAYLPDNQEGQSVVELLEKAFERKLTFHLERSGPNEEWVVEFDDIPHKTSLRGGKEGRGYPDPDYLAAVLAALSDYGLKDTIPQETDTAQDDEDQDEEESTSSAEATSDDKDEESDGDVSTGLEQTELTLQRGDAGGGGVPDVDPQEEENAGEKPVETSRTDENQLGSTHSSLPEGDTTTEHNGEGGAQHHLHSKMGTNSGTITAATNRTLTSSNLEGDPSSPPSSSPLDKEKASKKKEPSKRNAARSSLQASKEEAGRPRADRSTPEMSSTKKIDDPESKGTANVPGKAEPHRETPTESTATSSPKAGPEDLAIPKRGGSTSGQRKKHTHPDTPTEPSTASTPDECHEESTNPGSEDSTNGERNSDTPTKPRTPHTVNEDPDAPTNLESEVNTRGQKNGESDTEPRVTHSSAESQVQSTSPESKDATNGQDRDAETGPSTAHTSGENQEKSIKTESEVDKRGQKNEEQDVDSTTEARAPSTPEKAPEESTNSDVKVSTGGQRKNETHSDSQPESRPAPTSAGGREGPPTDARVTSISDEDSEKLANTESEVDMCGQNNRERDTGIPTETRPPATPAGNPEASSNPESEESMDGQKNEELDTSPEPRASATLAESPDAPANQESEESADGQKNEEGDPVTPMEPRAAPSSKKTPEESSNSENVISKDGQRMGKTHTDEPPASRTTLTPDGDPEAATSSKSKDGMRGQNKREMDTGTPTDSSSALTPVEDQARPSIPEGVTEETSHLHPKEVVKPEGKVEEAQAKLNDTEADVKNHSGEPKPKAGKPGEKGEEEEKTSSKDPGTDSKITVVGNMPPGQITSTRQPEVSVPGYNDCGVIIIDYIIPKGEQGAGHPEPGSLYSGCMERAFLPDNQEGQRVLQLLQEAFDRRLTFHLRQTGPEQEWEVEFADIPHKTSLRGGPERGGYPDPGYLEHVQRVLRDKYGIE